MLLQGLPTPIPVATIRDTLTVIVRERGYLQDVPTTLLMRGWEWLSRTLAKLFTNAAASRGSYLIVLALLLVLVLVTVTRALMVAQARRLAAARRLSEQTAAALRDEARALAAQGLYLDAAHRLYAAVVTALVEQRRVRRHPSKTVGDYGRDLRAGSDPLLPPYQAFARLYDVVAYGDGQCDAARFARLESLAAPMLDAPAPMPASRPRAA